MSEEQKQRAFDVVRAGFYLIASILVFQMFYVLIVTMACMYGRIGMGLTVEQAGCVEMRSMLSDILTGGLAAALAFVGGRNVPGK